MLALARLGQGKAAWSLMCSINKIFRTWFSISFWLYAIFPPFGICGQRLIIALRSDILKLNSTISSDDFDIDRVKPLLVWAE